MNPRIYFQNPFRPLRWRLDRVIQLIGHRPDPIRPRRYDDHYVRVYRLVLLELAAAGDDEAKLDAVLRANPDVCGAHRLHYSRDLERRQILEARLLTDETIEAIADRFGTTPKVIDYYEKLFFHVRDRLDCSDWIIMVIKTHRSSYRNIKNGEMTDEQRGYVYRLFAYYGGPLALDALVSGMITTTMPRFTEDVEGWFKGTLNQIVRTTAAAAAASLQLNQRNMLQVIRLGHRISAARSARRADDPPQNFDAWAEEVLATIGQTPAGRAQLERAESQKSSCGL